MFNLKGKTAFVTGASSGLGAHFAAVLAGAGANLILAARRLEALDELAAALRGADTRVTTLKLDVNRMEDLTAAFDANRDVDILVNNAGVVRDAAALDQSEDDWDTVVDTNLKGLFFAAQAAARSMRAAKNNGSIINIGSIAGLRQVGRVLPYAVSKAGVIQMTKVLALEVARFGIRVNALAPGYIDTPLNREYWQTEAGQALLRRIPQRRLGQPNDLDGPLLLLASEASRYMTGSVITVDGGHLVSTL